MNTPCVLCDCFIDEDGYGRRYHPPTKKTELAHRIAYIEHNGLTMADIKGVTIRHTCDNPPCINGEHLLAGTQLDNARDREERGRGRAGKSGLKGEAHGRAKLTEEQVRVIKKRLANGQYTSILASEFGVSKAAINEIKRGKNWAHVV